jgi:hypothetical protein
MKNTLAAVIAASTLVAVVIGMPSSAQSQVIVVIGNGLGQPYYTQPYPSPYPYPYPPVVYGEPSLYPAFVHLHTCTAITMAAITMGLDRMDTGGDGDFRFVELTSCAEFP